MTNKTEGLSPEAQAVVEQKRLTGKKRLSEWLPLLRELEAFDSANDEAYKKTKGKAVGMGCTGGILIFGSIFVVSILPAAVWLTGPVALGLIIAAIVFGVKASGLGKMDLENDLRLTLLPFLETIKEDIPPKGKIGLDLRLLSTVNKENNIGSTDLPTNFIKLTETQFEQKTCSATVPLENGSTLTLDITRLMSRFDRRYRSARGKYKSKRKWKALITVAAGLTPSGESVSFDDERVGGLAYEEKVKQKDNACRLVRRFKFKSADGNPPEEAVKPDDIIGMFMTLCKTLKSSQEGGA